jgi:hypothetical protein
LKKLILSDITIMGPGYCVIGLEQVSDSSYSSTRPFPPSAFAWREPFPFKRGDTVRYEPIATIARRPHIEDQQCNGLEPIERSLSEDELVECLRKAEVSPNLEQLFGCPPQSSSSGGRAVWVNPEEARRSVCGCEYDNIRFRLFPEREGFKLRAMLALASNERLESIPIVDREWRRFTESLVKRVKRADPLPLAERFLNRSVANKLCATPKRFARIGLPRPKDNQQCWLMLDSLFPQPNDSWLDEF